MGAIARTVSASVGVFLVLSTLAWPSVRAQADLALLVGVLATFVATAATFYAPLRFINTVLAIGLFVAAGHLDETVGGASVATDLVAASLLFIATLIPGSVVDPQDAAPLPRLRPVRA